MIMRSHWVFEINAFGVLSELVCAHSRMPAHSRACSVEAGRVVGNHTVGTGRQLGFLFTSVTLSKFPHLSKTHMMVLMVLMG